MKPKIAPRHIIPVVCYAVFLVISLLLAVVVGVSLQNLDVSGGSEVVDQGLPLIGLVAVGIAVAAIAFVFVLAIVAAVMFLFPLTFSIMNLQKRGRKLAIACLVFDAMTAEFFAFMLLFAFFSDKTSAIPLAYAAGLALAVLSMVMNIVNVKKNKPVEAAAEIAVEQDDLTA